MRLRFGWESEYSRNPDASESHLQIGHFNESPNSIRNPVTAPNKWHKSA